MADTIIQSLRDYFLTCPLMDGCRINVNYLPDSGMEYSIDTTPSTNIIKRYINGDSKRQYLFVIRSVQEYGSDALQNIANSGFYERFAEWLEKQNDLKHFPVLSADRKAERIEAQSTGYLFITSPLAGKYQIQCRLIYTQKG